MDSIVDANICKSSIRSKNPWNMLILVFVIFEDCIAPETGKKSDVLMYEIAPHSKEFASFRTKASMV